MAATRKGAFQRLSRQAVTHMDVQCANHLTAAMLADAADIMAQP